MLLGKELGKLLLIEFISPWTGHPVVQFTSNTPKALDHARQEWIRSQSTYKNRLGWFPRVSLRLVAQGDKYHTYVMKDNYIYKQTSKG